MLGADYWRGAAREVLCFGAGGAGTAITVALNKARARPSRIVVTDTDPTRLEHLRSVHEAMEITGGVEYRSVSSVADSDTLLGVVLGRFARRERHRAW